MAQRKHSYSEREKMEQVHHPAGQTQIMKVPAQYLGLVVRSSGLH